MEGKHSHTHTIIRETTERTESTMKHLEEKMIVIERVQNESQDGLKKEFDDLKDQTKKAENDLEERIKQVRNYLHVSNRHFQKDPGPYSIQIFRINFALGYF